MAMELGEKEREVVSQIQKEQNLEEVKKVVEGLDIFNRMRREIEYQIITELLKDGIQPSNEKATIQLLNEKTAELLRNPLIPPGAL